MITLLIIYVAVAALSYTYLAGKTGGKQGISARKCMFVMMWPIHALHSYIRMLRSWDQEHNND